MTSEDKFRVGITSVFRRPITAIKELSAGSLMGLMTAAGFLALFPGVGNQFGLDPQAVIWLGSIGTNILANWVQHFWEEANRQPPSDQEELLKRLAAALNAQLAESPEFRTDVAVFNNQVRAIDAATGALKGRDTDQTWFLITLYTETLEYRQEFTDRITGVDNALEMLGYKVDVILQNLPKIKQISTSAQTIDNQVQQFDQVLRSTIPWPTSLPPYESYYSLPERDIQLNNLMNLLRDPNWKQIIAIDGLGGSGKTAMAIEIGRRCLAEGVAKRIVGESAKQARLVGGSIVKIPNAPTSLDFEELLDAIARQLGRWDIPTMQLDEKRNTLQNLLGQTPYLIVVDNLEAIENAQSLVMELQSFATGNRIIVTSRPQLGLDSIHKLSIGGLSESDTFVFLRADAENRNLPQLLKASKRDLRRIHKVTDGAPLAMKLIAGQTSSLPLSVILNNVQDAKGDIYRFIYLETWNLLSLEAQRLLIYMGTVVTTCAYEELATIGVADSDEKLQEAIKEVVRFSLLNTNEGLLKKRYSIHQLTRNFLKADLPDIWKEQGLLS